MSEDKKQSAGDGLVSDAVFCSEFQDWVEGLNVFWCAWRCLTNFREWRRGKILGKASMIMGWQAGIELETESCKIFACIFSYPHPIPTAKTRKLYEHRPLPRE